MVYGPMLGIVLALTLVAPAGAAKYRGPRTDIFSGQGAGTWIIKTRAPRADGTLPTKIKCKPRRVCGPFGRKLALDLVPGGSTYSYAATFTLGDASCTLEASVYAGGFEGTYDCSDGGAGSISGR